MDSHHSTDKIIISNSESKDFNLFQWLATCKLWEQYDMQSTICIHLVT